MATTRATLRKRLVELITGEAFLEIDTTTSVDKSSVISTALADYVGGGDTDFFENKYVLITDSTHSAVGEARRASAYDGTSDITVSRDFSATVGSGTQVEILPYHPDFIHACINSAGRMLYPDIYLPTLDQTLVTNQLGTNMDFETWSDATTPGTWSKDTGPSFNRESSRVFHGTYSAKITGGTSDGGLYQDLTINIADLVGKSLTLGGMMWSTTADSGWFQIDYGGGDTSDSDKHDGDEDWQEENVQANVPSDASRIRIRVAAEADGTPVCFFDSLYCYSYPIYRYALPSGFMDHAPDSIDIAINRKDPLKNYVRNNNWSFDPDGETLYIRFHEQLDSGYRMRLRGKGALTLPSSDSASMEIANHRIDLVAEAAAMELFRRLAISGGGDDGFYRDRANQHERRVVQLLSRPGMRMPQGTNLRFPRK